MKHSKTSLESIDANLRRAARLLDRTTLQIRDAKLNPAKNIRKVGEALVQIFEIQLDIYRKQPNLSPSFLKQSSSPKLVFKKILKRTKKNRGVKYR